MVQGVKCCYLKSKSKYVEPPEAASISADIVSAGSAIADVSRVSGNAVDRVDSAIADVLRVSGNTVDRVDSAITDVSRVSGNTVGRTDRPWRSSSRSQCMWAMRVLIMPLANVCGSSSCHPGKINSG